MPPPLPPHTCSFKAHSENSQKLFFSSFSVSQMNNFLCLFFPLFTFWWIWTPIGISFTCVTFARFKMPLGIYFWSFWITIKAAESFFNEIMKKLFSLYFDEKLRRHEKMKNQYYSFEWKLLEIPRNSSRRSGGNDTFWMKCERLKRHSRWMLQLALARFPRLHPRENLANLSEKSRLKYLETSGESDWNECLFALLRMTTVERSGRRSSEVH